MSPPCASPGSLQVAFEVFDLCDPPPSCPSLACFPGSCCLEDPDHAVCCQVPGATGLGKEKQVCGLVRRPGGQEWPIGRVYRLSPPVLALGVQVRGVGRWSLAWARVRGTEDPSSR